MVLEISTTKEKQEVYPVSPSKQNGCFWAHLMNGESPLPPKPDKDNTEKREDQSVCFMNFGIKIISKILTNRAEQHGKKNITDQVEFIPGSETGSPFKRSTSEPYDVIISSDARSIWQKSTASYT